MTDTSPQSNGIQWRGVCLCRVIDIRGRLADRLAEATNGIQLLRPQDVDDPASINFALSFKPTPDAFALYKNLKLIASVAAGVDAIVKCPSRPAHVPVVRMMDTDQANQMAAFALWHVLYWHRDFPLILANQKEQRWYRAPGGRSPQAVRVGVLGFGFLGRRIAEILATLGYPVRSFSRRAPEPPMAGIEHYAGDGEFSAFLQGCDILINVLPMTEATRGILSQQLFQQLPMGAKLIQIGRGEHLNEADLIAALDRGQIGGASLDVFATEPLPRDHPFWHDDRILVTSHDASEAEEDQVVLMIRDALAAIERGEKPATAIDALSGY